MTFTPDPEKLSAMFDALDIADSCIRHMILDELRMVKLPELIAAEERAAEDFRDALAALRMPEGALSDLSRDIATAEGECASFSSQLLSDDISARIAARAAYQEWDAELTALSGKRDMMEKDLAPLREAREEAKNRLYWATRDREGIELNCSDPRYAYIGHGPDTDSFYWWKTYFAARTLQFGQHDDPGIESGRLFGQAEDYLGWLAHICGQKLVPDDWRTRQQWEDYRAEKLAGSPPVTPSGADIVRNDQAVYTRQAEDRRHRDVVEDHRHPALSIPVRDFMDVQRLRDIRT